MSITVTNLLQGPATIYVGPFGATEPTTADEVLDTAWKDVGATDSGAKLTITQKYSDMVIDQVALPVGTRLTEQSFSIDTALAEATLANLRIALNLASSTATELELDPTISNSEPNYAAVLLVGQRPGGGNRVVIIRRALVTANVEMAFQKDKMTTVPVTFSGYYVSQSIKPIKIDDTPAA